MDAITANHPECKTWIFLNACGFNLFFVGGAIRYLHQVYTNQIDQGHIGFVTISGSSFPIFNLIHSDNRIDDYDNAFTFWSEYLNISDNIYEKSYQWLMHKLKNKRKNKNGSLNLKHIVITTVFDSKGKINWHFHDCSTSSNISDQDYAKTVIASGHLQFLDFHKNKGITLNDGLLHQDGLIWKNQPSGTIDLLKLLNCNCLSLSYIYHGLLGLFMDSRETSLNMYLKGYNITRKNLEDKESAISKLLISYSLTISNKIKKDPMTRSLKKKTTMNPEILKYLLKPSNIINHLKYVYTIIVGIYKYNYECN